MIRINLEVLGLGIRGDVVGIMDVVSLPSIQCPTDSRLLVNARFSFGIRVAVIRKEIQDVIKKAV